MIRLRFILILMAATFCLTVGAQVPHEEEQAFQVAAKSFEGRFWARAEQEWRDFTIRFPLSPRVPEAVLYQARALVELQNHAGAVQLLQDNFGQAGVLADEYLFWIAEARYRAGNYRAAAQGYERLVREFPQSERALESLLGQAASRARLQQWGQVIQILENPAGALTQATPSAANRSLLAQGQLLLVEARLAVGDYQAAQRVLESTWLDTVEGPLLWQKQRLQAETLLALRQLPPALAASSNLIATATGTGRQSLLAEAVLFQGRVLEQMNEVDRAVAAYRQNLSTNAPPLAQRQTLLRLSELLISRERLAEARAVLENFLTLNPDPATVDLARLTLAELRLRQYAQATPGTGGPGAVSPDLLQQAVNDLEGVIQSAASRKVRGQAYLYRAWAEWMRGSYAESGASFEQAAALLPRSEDQLTARFKWADSLFRTGELDRARTNYQFVAELGPSVGGAALDLVEPALYQALRAGLELRRPDLTTDTLNRLLQDYPDGFFASTSVLLTGQQLNDAGDPLAARTMFEAFLEQSPESPLAPELRLAIARTYEAQSDWSRAIGQYESILASSNAPPVRARADYFRALDTAFKGDETNALSYFTNFVVAHATHTLAPRAQWWIGDYHWRRQDYVNAELNYQLLFKQWPESDLAYEARMMAGRAAMARLGVTDAISYFTNLTSDLKCPPDLKPKAMFAYGDALMRLKSANTNDPVANYAEAIKVFSSIERNYPSNSLAARAEGMMGDCYLQLAKSDPRAFLAASNAYQRAMTSPAAGVSTRSQAEVGLAVLLETQALKQAGEARNTLLQAALDHYLNVLYQKNLQEGEVPDPFWIRKAGLDAGRLAETLQLWTQARKIYEGLLESLPVLQPLLENKILKAHQAAVLRPE